MPSFYLAKGKVPPCSSISIGFRHQRCKFVRATSCAAMIRHRNHCCKTESYCRSKRATCAKVVQFSSSMRIFRISYIRVTFLTTLMRIPWSVHSSQATTYEPSLAQAHAIPTQLAIAYYKTLLCPSCRPPAPGMTEKTWQENH